jgi:hypothetical protein
MEGVLPPAVSDLSTRPTKVDEKDEKEEEEVGLWWKKEENEEAVFDKHIIYSRSSITHCL